MAKPNQYTAKHFIDVIPGTGGIVSEIARRAGVDWHTARKYIDEYPTVNRAWQNEREWKLDMAESALIKQVLNQEAWAVKFMLSTIGKDRGYTERTEVSGPGGGNIPIQYIQEARPNGDDTADS